MVAFYKHDIPAWRGGTASLTAEQYRVYHVVVEEIMLQEGPILAHERMLSGIANMSVRAFRAALEALIRLGKLSLNDGRVDNVRAGKELDFVRNNRENARFGGVSSGKSRRNGRESSVNGRSVVGEPLENPNDFNDGDEAPLLSAMKPKREEKRREEERREEQLIGDKSPIRCARASTRASPARARLSFDWKPSSEERQAARDRGLAESQIDTVAAEFADYWHSQKGEKAKRANWSAIWCNRIDDVVARRRGLNGHRNGETFDWERFKANLSQRQAERQANGACA